MSRELSRSMSNKGLSYKGDDTTVAGEMLNERNQGRDRETPQASSWEKQKIAASSEIGASKTHSVLKSDTISSVSEISAASLSTAVTQSAASINETEKLWRYQDPSGKIQGPFSMVQLRKWNNTGYFPANLRIWRATERQDDSLLLTDALAGKFQKDPPLVDNSFPKAQVVHKYIILIFWETSWSILSARHGGSSW
jgi:phage FluMu protein gp41